MSIRGNSAASRDVANVLHPYTNLKAFETTGPLMITRGQGVFVYDEEGHEYLEAMAGLWCASLGFSEERLVEAAARQMRTLPFYHNFSAKAHDQSALLAETLIGMMPVPMARVFFNNSGSEAVDTAVKLIWYYNNALGRHRKKKLLARIGGYHGVTVAGAGLTGLVNNHRDFDLPLPQIRHVDCPHWYRFAKLGETEEDFASRLAENLEAQILREGPDTIAAFFAEPIQGAGGVIVPPATYFAKIQPILKKYDILLVADEVITGFGRTGKMFGSETFGIEPDIIIVAKQLSAAFLPISATIINDKIYQALVSQSEKIGVFAHGFTYGGHPVPCAVARETLAIYQERNILAHVNRISPVFQSILRGMSERRYVGEARGMALIGALELVQDKTSKTLFDPKLNAAAKLSDFCLGHGMIVRAIGNAVALCPPMVISEAELTQINERLNRAMDDFEIWARDT